MDFDNSRPPFDSLAASRMKPNVVAVAHEVNDASQRYFSGGDRPIKVMFGFNAASQPEHSAGTAIDFMVYQDQTLGDWIADYLWANRARLGLRWQIWRQRIRSTSPGHSGLWTPMADRGSTTQNHFDHVHTNFWEQTYVGAGKSSAASAVPSGAGLSVGPLAPVPHQPDPSKTPQEEAMIPQIITVLGPDNKSVTDDSKALLTVTGIHPIRSTSELSIARRFCAVAAQAVNPAKDAELNVRERDVINEILKR